MTGWLVTGGAGYIGAHVAEALLESGREVVVLDDLSTGRRDFVPAAATFVEGTLLDRRSIDAALALGVTGVIHLAGFKFAGESVRRPMHTYRQNVTAMIELLDAMRDAGVARIVFSSSAGVYGSPDVERVTEDTPPAPASPYGASKLIGERLIADERAAALLDHRAFRGVSLRYFNVIGSASARIRDTSPHNLVPKVLADLERGATPAINGDDYATPDGTNVRDYVHVRDVALAHVAAAERLETGQTLEHIYNLGSGEGASTRQLMTAIASASGVEFRPSIAPRRPGDPAAIVADGSLAARDLGWRNRYGIDEMVASAWEAARAQSRP